MHSSKSPTDICNPVEKGKLKYRTIAVIWWDGISLYYLLVIGKTFVLHSPLGPPAFASDTDNLVSLDRKLRLHFYIRKLSFAWHIDTSRHKLSKQTSSTSAWIPANSGLVKFSQNLGLFRSNTFNISEGTKKMVKPVSKKKKIDWIHWKEEIQVFINFILINYDLVLIVVSWQLFGIIHTFFSDCCKQLIKLLSGSGHYKIN